MAGFVRIRQVESRPNLSFGRTLRLSSDRHDLIPPPSDCLKTSFRERIIWIDGFKKNEILKSQRLNFTF